MRPLNLLPVAVIGLLGCNSILGIQEGHLVGTGGGKGAGGALGSGGADAGLGGGGAPDASSGGTSVGGASNGGAGIGGSGVDGGADAGAMRGPADLPGEIRCGQQSCDLGAGQVCCATVSTGDAHCSQTCDSSTEIKLTCDGAEDCTSGDTCCYPFGQATASCATSCAAGGRVFCGTDGDCAPGQYCAPGGGALETVFVCKDVPKTKFVFCAGAPCDLSLGRVCCYDKTTQTEACTTSCAGSNVIPFACDGDDDCAGTQRCCADHTGLGLFTGTACAASCSVGANVACEGAGGVCTAGDSCCEDVHDGTVCGATCTTRVTCTTSADCPAGETCTLTTAAGLGQASGTWICQ